MARSAGVQADLTMVNTIDELMQTIDELTALLERAIDQRNEAIDMALTLHRTGEPYPQFKELWRLMGGRRLNLARKAYELDSEIESNDN